MPTQNPTAREVIADYLNPRQWLKDLSVSFHWLQHYERKHLAGDLIAGLTVAIMLIPQSMAYALLAGLPPIVGLYASILPVLIYGLLGSAGVMTLGPTAITSVMTLSTIGQLANGDLQHLIILGGTLALLLGMVYLLMAALRLGFIVNLLSQPVIIGYVNAAAIIIAVSQLQHLLGVDFENSPFPHILLWRTILAVPQANLATLSIGLGAVLILLFFRYPLDALLKPLIANETLRFIITRSGALLVTLLGTLLVFSLRLNETMGVQVVGVIPQGFPPLTYTFDFSEMQTLLLGAVAIAFVGFMEDISTAKSLVQERQHAVNANHEMLAMGVANVAAALTGGLPVTTSISRSAVNYAAGGKTGLSSILASGLLLLTVLFLTQIFYFLPRAILAAIILTSVISLIRPQDFKQLWRFSQTESVIAFVTVLGVFLVNIQMGILLGIVLMIALYVYRSSRPEILELGRLDYTKVYGNIHLPDALAIPHVTILKINESLYFANAQYLEQYLRSLMSQDPEIDYLILDCSAVNTIDASAMQILELLIRDFSEHLHIEIFIVGLKGRVYSKIRSAQLRKELGEMRLFNTIHEAVEATGQLMDHLLPI